MSIGEEMHSVTREIVSSFDARAAGLASLREDVATQREATLAQLHNLNRDHQAMASQQRAALTKGRADLNQAEGQRKSLVHAWMKDVGAAHQAMASQQRAALTKGRADLNQAEGQRKSLVHAWMKDVGAVHGEARQEWQNLAATMQARRGGASAELGDLPAELASLGNRVFGSLANHPDGTRLTELEREFGLSRIQMAKVVRNLMDEGKVEKRDLLYFAI